MQRHYYFKVKNGIKCKLYYGSLNRVKKVKIPTHEFHIQIPIIQKENLLTPEENNTLAQYIISLGDVQ